MELSAFPCGVSVTDQQITLYVPEQDVYPTADRQSGEVFDNPGDIISKESRGIMLNDGQCAIYSQRGITIYEDGQQLSQRYIDCAFHLNASVGYFEQNIIVYGGYVKSEISSDVIFVPYIDGQLQEPIFKQTTLPRAGATLIAFYNKLFLFGGSTGTRVYGEIYELFTDSQEIQSEKIEFKNKLPPLMYAQAIVYRNYIVVAGGTKMLGAENFQIFVLHYPSLDLVVSDLKLKLKPENNYQALFAVGDVMYENFDQRIFIPQLIGHFRGFNSLKNDVQMKLRPAVPDIELRFLSTAVPCIDQIVFYDDAMLATSEDINKLTQLATNTSIQHPDMQFMFQNQYQQQLFNDFSGMTFILTEDFTLLLCSRSGLQLVENAPDCTSVPPRRYFASCFASESTFFIFGGMNEENVVLSDLYQFDINSEGQLVNKKIAHLPVALFGANLLFLNNQLYLLFGAVDNKGQKLSKDVFQIDFEKQSFNKIEIYGGAGGRYGAFGMVLEEKAIFVGGERIGGQDVILFDPVLRFFKSIRTALPRIPSFVGFFLVQGGDGGLTLFGPRFSFSISKVMQKLNTEENRKLENAIKSFPALEQILKGFQVPDIQGFKDVCVLFLYYRLNKASQNYEVKEFLTHLLQPLTDRQVLYTVDFFVSNSVEQIIIQMQMDENDYLLEFRNGKLTICGNIQAQEIVFGNFEDQKQVVSNMALNQPNEEQLENEQ